MIAHRALFLLALIAIIGAVLSLLSALVRVVARFLDWRRLRELAIEEAPPRPSCSCRPRAPYRRAITYRRRHS